MITAKLFDDTKSLPLIIEPTGSAPENRSLSFLIDWIKNNRASFNDWLLTHGALLFRGFEINTPEEFGSVVRVIEPELLGYVEGDSPRRHVSEKIYTSTQYPQEYEIALHNELSYAHKWPSKVFFFCVIPPEQKGETPIVDCREVFQAVKPGIREQFTHKKVKYIHNLHGGFGMGKSWQDCFETEDKGEVEKYLREGGVEFIWRDDGGLRVSQVREATITHPKTGEQVWFNQADIWHPSLIDAETLEALSDMCIGIEDLPHNSFYGDGSAIDPDDLRYLRSLMRERAVFFPWQKSDFLVVDNVLVAHGRNSYEGERQILVALA